MLYRPFKAPYTNLEIHIIDHRFMYMKLTWCNTHRLKYFCPRYSKTCKNSNKATCPMWPLPLGDHFTQVAATGSVRYTYLVTEKLLHPRLHRIHHLQRVSPPRHSSLPPNHRPTAYCHESSTCHPER